MSFERRALIAFAASILLFLIYDAVYLSPRMKEQRARKQAEEIASGDTVTAQPAAPPAPEPTLDTSESTTTPRLDDFESPMDTVTVAARHFVVASPLYEFTLTTAGGEMSSARLLHYLTDDEPVELFPQNPGWTYERALNVALSGGGSVSLHGVSFDAFVGGGGSRLNDGERIDVDAQRGYTDILMRGTLADGRIVERSYRFYIDRYAFDAGVKVSSEQFPDVTTATWGIGPGMTATERNVNDDQGNFKASVLLGEEHHRLKPSHFSNKSRETYQGTLSWLSVQTKYFMTAIVPTEPTRAEVEIVGNKEGHRVSGRAAMPIAARGGFASQTVRVYVGPLDFSRVEGLGVGLERNIEMGMKVVRPVSWLVLRAMIWMHKVVPNYGWVIIIISVLTKVLFYRLTHKSFKSMKEMQALQPKLQALKEKYGDDRQRLSQETMKLYKEAGVNPLGGCLPMLLQMPVFIALFNVLKFTIEVRGARWIGWIDDLSQQDVLFTLPFPLPFLGDAFSVLPILMGASMFAQSKLGGSPTGGPSSTVPAGFNTLLPIVFTVLFYKMPSGLVLYWIVNTVLSVAQQYYIHRESTVAVETSNQKTPTKRRLKTKER